MLLTDYHIHSDCSSDGYHPMREMAAAAYARGIGLVCFTDHCDLDDFITGRPVADPFDHKERILEMYAQALSGKPEGLEIRLGLELGSGNHDPAQAAEIAATKELDFVLGSLHNLRDTPDFYEYDYQSGAECRNLIDRYLDELLELAKLDFYDVMAHIGYTVRYMRRQGFDLPVSATAYPDKMGALLRALIEGGRGIEINCAGYRDPVVGGAVPTADVLRRYRELGGEIITVGSDAHKLEHAGVGVREGYELLRELGYRYITVYEKRRPRFIKL